MLASEAVPYVKTGGLGDVMGALPAALAREGLEVSLLLPLYRGLRARFADAGVGPLAVRMHDGVEQAAVLRALDEPPGVRVFAIAGDRYFEVLSGLEPGDQVITGPFNNVRNLRDGDGVKIQAPSDRQR